MTKRLSKQTIAKQAVSYTLPIFVAVVPFILSVLLFVLALIMLELSGGLNGSPENGIEQVFDSIGNISAALAYLIFSIIVPISLVAAVVLFAYQVVARRKK